MTEPPPDTGWLTFERPGLWPWSRPETVDSVGRPVIEIPVEVTDDDLTWIRHHMALAGRTCHRSIPFEPDLDLLATVLK